MRHNRIRDEQVSHRLVEERTDDYIVYSAKTRYYAFEINPKKMTNIFKEMRNQFCIICYPKCVHKVDLVFSGCMFPKTAQRKGKKKNTPASGSLIDFSDFFYHNFQCNKYSEQISIELIQEILIQCDCVFEAYAFNLKNSIAAPNNPD